MMVTTPMHLGTLYHPNLKFYTIFKRA